MAPPVWYWHTSCNEVRSTWGVNEMADYLQSQVRSFVGGYSGLNMEHACGVQIGRLDPFIANPFLYDTR